MAQTTDNV